jgi:hypothetical protein
MRFLKSTGSVIILLLSIGLSGGVSAATTPVGTLDPGDTYYFSEGSQTPDTYTFTLSAPSDVLIKLQSGSEVTINGFLTGGGVDQSGDEGLIVEFLVTGLAADTPYELLVTKDPNQGQPNGQPYTGSISAVPLPAAAWLFGSAIMGLTLVARRRRNESVA